MRRTFLSFAVSAGATCVLLLSLAVAAALPGCADDDSADRRDTDAQEQALSEASRQVGLPKIVNWTEKKLVATLYELRDQASLPTWTYLVDMHGKRHFLCKSLGYGIPYAAQFSSPEKEVLRHGGYAKMPQAEPNGLFMPESAHGTWVMMATASGPKPLYVEPDVIVSPVPLPDDATPEVAPK